MPVWDGNAVDNRRTAVNELGGMGDSCFVIVLLLFLPEKPIQEKKGRNDVWCNIKTC